VLQQDRQLAGLKRALLAQPEQFASAVRETIDVPVGRNLQ
jgi:hypothetical protein